MIEVLSEGQNCFLELILDNLIHITLYWILILTPWYVSNNSFVRLFSRTMLKGILNFSREAGSFPGFTIKRLELNNGIEFVFSEMLEI